MILKLLVLKIFSKIWHF